MGPHGYSLPFGGVLGATSEPRSSEPGSSNPMLRISKLTDYAVVLTTHLAAARRLRLIHLLLDEERPDTTLFLTTLLGHDT